MKKLFVVALFVLGSVNLFAQSSDLPLYKVVYDSIKVIGLRPGVEKAVLIKPYSVRVFFLDIENSEQADYEVKLVVNKLSTSIDNAASLNNFTGNWVHASNDGGWFQDTFSYGNDVNGSMTVKFTGTKIEWYTEQNKTHGIAAISIDGGEEVMVDLYGDIKRPVLKYTSPTLSYGEHTFKIRPTGKKNAASSHNWVIHDYLKVYLR